MQQVERHRIDWHDPRFASIDAAAFASKHLYNAALYLVRQRFITDEKVIPYGDLDKLMQPTEQYKTLPAKVAQWVLKQVCFAWKSYLRPVPLGGLIPRSSWAIPSYLSISISRDATCSPIQSRRSAA